MNEPKTFAIQTGVINVDQGIDITVSSASGIWKLFAPSWSMVMDYKYGKLDMYAYTENYFEILDKIEISFWKRVFELEEVTFLCYCQKGKFCHKDLLAYYIIFQYYHNQEANHNITLALKELNKKPMWINGDKIYQNINKKIFSRLECSSIGDKRFSAFFASLVILGQSYSIEQIYQSAKRFKNFTPIRWQEAKGKHPSHFHFLGQDFPLEALTAFYHWLWLKYLDKHPNLVKYASMFETFTDKFRGNSINCQALSIELYIKHGREEVVKAIQPYYDKFESLIHYEK